MRWSAALMISRCLGWEAHPDKSRIAAKKVKRTTGGRAVLIKRVGMVVDGNLSEERCRCNPILHWRFFMPILLLAIGSRRNFPGLKRYWKGG